MHQYWRWVTAHFCAEIPKKWFINRVPNAKFVRQRALTSLFLAVLAAWLCGWQCQSTTLFQTKISHQPFDGFPLNYVQTFVIPRGWILLTLVILWFSIERHHEVEILNFGWNTASQQLLDGFSWSLMCTFTSLSGWIIMIVWLFIYHHVKSFMCPVLCFLTKYLHTPETLYHLNMLAHWC